MATEALDLRYIGPNEILGESRLVDILREYEQNAHLGDSQSSRRVYLTQARLFLRWLDGAGMPLQQATPETVAAWRRHVEQQGYKPATVALKLVAVRKFLLWAQDQGHTAFLQEDDLVTKMRNGQKTSLAPPNVNQGPVRYLDFPDLQKLLRAPFEFTRKDGTRRQSALRDALILSLLALRGLREGELVTLTVGSFEPRGDGAILTVAGKGRKRRQLDLDADLWNVVKGYLRETGRSPANAHRDSVLLSGQRGPMTAQGIIDVVRRHGRRALDRDDVTPHMLRRTFATLASRELRDARGNVVKPAMPPYVLQRLLGHEDLKTTQRYVDAAAQADGIPTGTYLGIATPTVPTKPEDDERGVNSA